MGSFPCIAPHATQCKAVLLQRDAGGRTFPSQTRKPLLGRSTCHNQLASCATSPAAPADNHIRHHFIASSVLLAKDWTRCSWRPHSALLSATRAELNRSDAAQSPAPTRSASASTGPEAESQHNVELPEPVAVRDADGNPTQFPSSPGVYAVYDAARRLQYVGMSRKVAASIANHVADLPDLAHAVAVIPVEDASRDGLMATWTRTIQAAVSASGEVPPGNVKGNKTWTQRRSRIKPEVRLTPGKGLGDLTVPLEDIIQQVVSQNRVVAFVKGTRTAPQCGFSHQVLTLLNSSRCDYEVVNVLDEVHNPGLRETLKTFSQWPTIPQLYVDGELVGGADIVLEMAGKGELNRLLTAK